MCNDSAKLPDPLPTMDEKRDAREEELLSIARAQEKRQAKWFNKHGAVVAASILSLVGLGLTWNEYHRQEKQWTSESQAQSFRDDRAHEDALRLAIADFVSQHYSEAFGNPQERQIFINTVLALFPTEIAQPVLANLWGEGSGQDATKAAESRIDASLLTQRQLTKKLIVEADQLLGESDVRHKAPSWVRNATERLRSAGSFGLANELDGAYAWYAGARDYPEIERDLMYRVLRSLAAER